MNNPFIGSNLDDTLYEDTDGDVNGLVYVKDIMESDITTIRVRQALGEYTGKEAALLTAYIEKYIHFVEKYC